MTIRNKTKRESLRLIQATLEKNGIFWGGGLLEWDSNDIPDPVMKRHHRIMLVHYKLILESEEVFRERLKKLGFEAE